jgi:hypothetical protein
MKAKEYKKMIRRIRNQFGKALNMNLLEVCQVCDDVLFGRQTEEQLVSLLNDAVKDN